MQNENGEILDYYNDIITSPKEYQVVWWKIIENSFNIEFTITFYDDYGNIIAKENKHLHTNILKDEYDKLVEKYNKEYEYYQSSEYLDSLSNNINYIYTSYYDGDFNYNSEHNLDFYGRIKRYYNIAIRRNTRQYKLIINWNSNPITYPDQITEYTLEINSLYPAPLSEYYYVDYDEYGYAKFYYFIGFDADGDGVVDYKPGDMIIINGDLNLTACWE